MSKLLLIDAVHPEETRVALVSNGSVDDFDFEAAGKRQLRGNIYLAKVTRVEPSLQAAFVEYGGNRQGFLAFSEIHPDYYQLPQEDREALLREEAELAAAEAEDDEVDDPSEIGPDDEEIDVPDEDEAEAEAETEADTDAEDEPDTDVEDEASAETETEDTDATAEDDDASEDEDTASDKDAKSKRGGRSKSAAASKSRRRRSHPSRRYKIQEVIRRRQVMLIQVVKEERGNKGAALTTYLSLAGRYCVLMPNTPRGGGISRKIANSSDRKRLKTITNDLSVPDGMGLIVRTAGAKRSRSDIKRDFNYLQKLWDTIREKTLNSMAPTLVNEEGGLVHRAMRDLYDKDVEEVLIQGPDAYREAKDLARMLMPSQAKKVKQWKSPAPLFVSKRVEEQLDSIFSPVVKLKSGGYLVINQTEALVAIDVNSGKSTRGRNIEQTATQTNLEAAEEACRQMRLRDLAGLIVIDFIDMDESKNNRAVEKKMRGALSLDRARVQNARISQFGLMEISRQRRRTGVYESSSTTCTSCDGTGRQRSIESAALQLLRAIEARAATGKLLSLSVEAPADVALYLFNQKRDAFNAIEEEAGMAISISSSDALLPGDFKIEAEKDPKAKRRRSAKPIIEGDADDEEFAAAIAAQDKEDNEGEPEIIADEEAPRGRNKRGRRGGRKRRPDFEDSETAKAAAEATAAALTLPPITASAPSGKNAPPEDGGAYLDGLTMQMAEVLDENLTDVAPLRNRGPSEDGDDEDKPKRKRRSRRGRRGGRRRNRDENAAEENESASEDSAETDNTESDTSGEIDTERTGDDPAKSDEAPRKRRPRRRSRRRKDTTSEEANADTPAETESSAAQEAEPEAKPQPAPTPDPEPAPVKAAEPDPAPAAKAKPKKRGWWSRKKA